MNRSTRALAAVVTAATLTLTGQALQSAATAKPHADGSHGHHGKAAAHGDHGKAGSHGRSAKGDAAKVAREAARIRAALERAVRASRIEGLDAGVQTKLGANVDEDMVALAILAADTTKPSRDVRRELRAVRPQNYAQAINILREASELEVVAVGTPEASGLVGTAVAKALTLTAFSPKSDVHAARADLAQAESLLGLTDDVEGEGEGDLTDGEGVLTEGSTSTTEGPFATMPAIPVATELATPTTPPSGRGPR